MIRVTIFFLSSFILLLHAQKDSSLLSIEKADTNLFNWYSIDNYGINSASSNSKLPNRTYSKTNAQRLLGDHGFGFLPNQIGEPQGAFLEDLIPSYLKKPNLAQVFKVKPVTRLGYELISGGAQEFYVQHSRFINNNIGFIIETQSQSYPGLYANSSSRYTHFGGTLFINGLFPKHRMIFSFSRDTIGQSLPGIITGDISQIPNPRSGLTTSESSIKTEYKTQEISIDQFYYFNKPKEVQLNDSVYSRVFENGLAISSHTKYEEQLQLNSAPYPLDTSQVILSSGRRFRRLYQDAGIMVQHKSSSFLELSAFYEQLLYGIQILPAYQITNFGVKGHLRVAIPKQNLILDSDLKLVLIGQQALRIDAEGNLSLGGFLTASLNYGFIPNGRKYYLDIIHSKSSNDFHSLNAGLSYQYSAGNFSSKSNFEAFSRTQYLALENIPSPYSIYDEEISVNSGQQTLVQYNQLFELQINNLRLSHTSYVFLSEFFNNSDAIEQSIPLYGTENNIAIQFPDITTLSNIELGLSYRWNTMYSPSYFIPGLQIYGYSNPSVEVQGIHGVGAYASFLLNQVSFRLEAQNLEEGILQEGLYTIGRKPGPYRQFSIGIQWDFLD